MVICNDEAANVDADFTSPSDLRFRDLRLKRWVRARMIGVVRMFHVQYMKCLITIDRMLSEINCG